MTKTNSAAIYTQAELDAHLQAERVNMVNAIAFRALDPLQTMQNYFLLYQKVKMIGWRLTALDKL